MIAGMILLWALSEVTTHQDQAKPYLPQIAKESGEGVKAMAGFKIPKGFKLDLFASEPHLANPVAFTIDDKNRFFVVETFRLHNGTIDIRSFTKWLDDDLGLKSVAERTKLLEKIAVACLRCHKVAGQGGEVGPELTGIGAKQKRDYLLESLIQPEKSIAKGFESLILVLNNGKTITGILKQDNAMNLVLMDADGKLITVKKSEIEEEKTGKSAMPADLYKQLSKNELRDLVEYLATLK